MNQWRKRDLIIRLVVGIPLITILIIYSSYADENSFPVAYITSFGLSIMFIAIGINSWMHEKYTRTKWELGSGSFLLLFLLIFVFLV
ncbi:hypothetical protein ACTHQ4_11405 [Alkalicoccobacillus gibsonii]|uniref:hypothetical protein n=1 Tax=Alkalicoccobacillus gibsonii TaxID=79881 RepID=UPI003F7BF46B